MYWRRALPFSARTEPTGYAIVGGDLLVVDLTSSTVLDIKRRFWREIDLATVPKEPPGRTRYRDKIDAFVSGGQRAKQTELRNAGYFGTTPLEIPGGAVIGSGSLARLLADSRNNPSVVVISVIEERWGLPGAVKLPFAGEGGSFGDSVSARLSKSLSTLTDGRLDAPLVFYCHHANCWLSFNAALRAIDLGYTNVSWYRYGLEAWRRHDLPLQEVRAAHL